MATYKKALKEVEVITLCGETYTVADTTEKSIGSDAFSQFEHGETMALHTAEGEVTYVPYHAVCAVIVRSSTGDAEKGDPYHCEEV